MKDRYCSTCNKVKPIENFSRNKSNRSGYVYECKSCRAERDREWRDNNPEKVIEYNRKHNELAKERANK